MQSSILTQTRTQILLLLLLPVVVYSAAMTGDFVYDDVPITVLQNPALSGEADVWEVLSWSRPLREFTYMLDHALWGFNPVGYHVQNLIWHLANVLLLYAFIKFLGVHAKIAFTTALLFAIHPLQTESAAWISGRKELLCFFFEMAACFAFVYSLSRNDVNQPIKRMLYGVSLLFVILALLSKQVAIMAPLLMALCAWLYFRNHAQRVEMNTIAKWLSGPLILVFFFTLFRYDIARVFTQVQDQGVYFDPASRDVSLSLLSFLLTPFATFAHSVGLFVFPYHLTVEHGFSPGENLFDLRWLAGFVLIVVLMLISFYYRRFPALLFGVFWFLISWAPVSGAVPVSYLFAERYLYIPLVGLCLFACTLAYHFLQWIHSLNENPQRHRRICRMAQSVFVVVMLMFSARTFDRTLDWQNEIALWQSAIEIRPDYAELYFNLGNAYIREGEYQKAYQSWNQALKLNPNLPQVWVNRGNALENQGKTDEALQSYMNALEIFPEYGLAHFNLALLYENKENIEKALHHFQEAAEHLYGRRNQKHRKGLAHYHIARIHYQAGRIEAAQAHIKHAIQLAGSVGKIHILHGWIKQNQPQAAKQAFETAIQLNPNSAEPYFNYGLWHWQKGDPDVAQELWRKTLQLNPEYATRIQAAQSE